MGTGNSINESHPGACSRWLGCLWHSRLQKRVALCLKGCPRAPPERNSGASSSGPQLGECSSLWPQSCQGGMISWVVRERSGRAQASSARGPGASRGTSGRTETSDGAMRTRDAEVR